MGDAAETQRALSDAAYQEVKSQYAWFRYRLPSVYDEALCKVRRDRVPHMDPYTREVLDKVAPPDSIFPSPSYATAPLAMGDVDVVQCQVHFIRRALAKSWVQEAVAQVASLCNNGHSSSTASAIDDRLDHGSAAHRRRCAQETLNDWSNGHMHELVRCLCVDMDWRQLEEYVGEQQFAWRWEHFFRFASTLTQGNTLDLKDALMSTRRK